MARKRVGTVKESPDQLKELALIYQGKKEKRIIEMLLLLKEHPDCTTEWLADSLDCTVRTIGRWWTEYREGAIDRIPEAHGSAGAVVAEPVAEPLPAPATAPPVFDPGLVQFLNDLPVYTAPSRWIEQFRQLLRDLFPDIDRVTVNVNLYYDLSDPHYRPSSFMVVEHVKEDGKRSVSTRERQMTPGEHLLEEARKLKFPFDLYHPPHVLDFTMPEGMATIGTIILWRENWKPEISERTLAALEQLRPFIAFLLSDCVARRQREKQDIRFFTHVINQVAEKDGLSRREQEALLHHLFGNNYRKIAAEMNIAVNTVRKHVKSIHTKTGTHSVAELFARYLSPLSQL
jgi:DNA-binding CsgD family transcriptional regulator